MLNTLAELVRRCARRKHPRRRVVRVGPDRMVVLLSPEDQDLARLHWYLHPKGYVWRRFYHGTGDARQRQAFWLHHEVAARMLVGQPWPREIRFRNGARLDCRRENLYFEY